MSAIFRQLLRPSAATQALRVQTLRLCSSGNKTPAGASTTTTAAPLFDKDTLDKLVRTNKVVIFMKGNPEAPRCGFSNAVVQIMRMHGVNYDAHDVLQNEELRQSIKEFTEWPTIPQIFINGEFVGGCDILLQMHQSGDLIEELKKVGIESQLLREAAAQASTATQAQADASAAPTKDLK